MCEQGLSPLDPSSYSRSEFVKVTQIDLNLEVNFETKILSGHVDLNLCRIDPKANEVVLDSLDLKINEITETKLNKKLDYTLGCPFKEYGSKLTIQLPQGCPTEVTIRIKYTTSPSSHGIQWLTPDQTEGKTHPYLFTQFQPISARSMIPLQDTPSVKSPYTATIIAPSDYTVLMSAISKSSEKICGGTTKHYFEQKNPIPSYLIALVVGVIESREISPRIKVWAEKEIVCACAYEFANTEVQLSKAEEICGPYVWERYDLLILPPSFPYGGMENPCLTFVTPTLLAGDRTLTNVVSHEISHSWSGNLVTNSNFEHFWINEGFTIFLERRIMGRLESVDAEDFAVLLGIEELKEEIKLLGENNQLTALRPNLKNTHPDDAFSSVPYEKGSIFVRYLEETVGGCQVFEQFLKIYFETYKYKSLDAYEFKAFFEKYFEKTCSIKNIDWDTWLNSPGMPISLPKIGDTYQKACQIIFDQLKSDVKKVSEKEISALTSAQVIYLLQMLTNCPPFSSDQLNHIAQILNVKGTKNAEILFRWYRLCVIGGKDEIVDEVVNWISTVGRMKFIRPLYRDLYANEKYRAKAIENFKKNKNKMMFVSAYTVEGDLQLRKE